MEIQFKNSHAISIYQRLLSIFLLEAAICIIIAIIWNFILLIVTCIFYYAIGRLNFDLILVSIFICSFFLLIKVESRIIPPLLRFLSSIYTSFVVYSIFSRLYILHICFCTIYVN